MAETKQSPKDGKFYSKNDDGSWSPVIKVSPKNGKTYVQTGTNQWEEDGSPLSTPAEFNPLSAVGKGVTSLIDLDRKLGAPQVLASMDGAVQEGENRFNPLGKDLPPSSEMLKRVMEKRGVSPVNPFNNPVGQQVGGFALDMMTPSSLASLGAAGLVKNSPRIAKAIEAMKWANPIGELAGQGIGRAADNIGSSMWKSPFKKIDVENTIGRKKGEIGKLIEQYGITGNYEETLNKLRNVLKETEGPNIGSYLDQSGKKWSADEIKALSGGAIPDQAGSLGSKDDILGFIDDELSRVADVRGLTSQNSKYKSDYSDYLKNNTAHQERDLSQGKLFRDPQVRGDFDSEGNGLLGIGDIIAPQAGPMAPVRPDDKIFTAKDIFDLRGNLAHKAKSGFSGKSSAAISNPKADQMSGVYGAMNNEIEAALPAASIPGYKGTMDRYGTVSSAIPDLEKAAIAEAKQPFWNLKGIELNRPSSWTNVIPDGILPGVGAQTKAGKLIKGSGKSTQANPWLIRALPKLIEQDYKDEQP